MRCDASTGYTYDMNVYAGRKKRCEDTVGERIVFALAGTIKNQDATSAFNRYFTLVRLIDTLPFAAVGTCIKNRKLMPSFTTLKKSESNFKSNNNETTAVRWQETKKVVLLSNCYTDSMGQIQKKQKDGSSKSTTCPTAIQFYRKKMGGVDRTDQK